MLSRASRVSYAARGGTKRSKPARTLIDAGHDYVTGADDMKGTNAGTHLQEEEFPSLPISPSKSPALKKKACGAEVSPSLLTEMHEQFAAVKTLINSRCDSLENKITTLEDKIARISADLNAVNTKVVCLEQRVLQVEQRVKQVQRKIKDLESHSRRMNL